MKVSRSVWTIGRRTFFMLCSFTLLFQLDCARVIKESELLQCVMIVRISDIIYGQKHQELFQTPIAA